MREFLFRGKTDSGEWRYGDLRRDVNSGLYGIVSPDNAFSYVNPETVCQYTGVLDKNGVRIFENDIICFDVSSKPRRVMWFEKWGGFYATSVTGYGEPIGTPLSDMIEIIGNSFDNPKMWKKRRKEYWRDIEAGLDVSAYRSEAAYIHKLERECEELQRRLSLSLPTE